MWRGVRRLRAVRYGGGVRGVRKGEERWCGWYAGGVELGCEGRKGKRGAIRGLRAVREV